MTGNIVARRYARALFALGKKNGREELEANATALAAFREALVLSPVLLKFFHSPIFSLADKTAVVKKLATKLGVAGTVLNFCLLLAEKKRLSALESIANVYDELLDAEKGILRGKLITAVTLDEKRQNTLVTKFEKQTKRTLVLDFSVAPEILGGVVLKVGDQVMDASLRAQLSILKDTIKRGE